MTRDGGWPAAAGPLTAALQVGPGEAVALVGGGGKTTTMFRLASEIVAAGGRVVTTTTTRIFAAQTRLAPVHVQSLAALREALITSPHVLFTGELNAAEGKALGIDSETGATLQTILADAQWPITILIEADGSRMRPFKAPAEHEPVIPPWVTRVVPVVGIEVIGQPLDAQFVHRPECVAALQTSYQQREALGRPVTPEMVAAVLAHPQGGRKNVPPGAQFIPFLNKVESEQQQAQARAIAERLLAQPEVDGVVAGAAAIAECPVVRRWWRVDSP